mmetsp:Transcript_56671/g.156923  ORF Transcript_56671/g.156923 Transcript_56671/m.156923 type:complete len:90 (-) Transcript_56671:105-374(-)
MSEDPFKDDNFKIFCPKVPRQRNKKDCGAYVCKYAEAVYGLRNLDGFELELELELDFEVKDIARFREEFKTLIEELSVSFQKGKATEKA